MKFRRSVIDAIRVSDGTLVYIKRVRTDSQELRILSYLSSDTLRLDPRNHCVPLLDAIQDPADPDTTFMVMPYLRYITSPPFEVVGDVLECIDQILEVRHCPSFLSLALTLPCRDLYLFTIKVLRIGTAFYVRVCPCVQR